MIIKWGRKIIIPSQGPSRPPWPHMIKEIRPCDERQTINGLRLKGSKVNVLRHKLLWINERKPKDGMYPSDEKPKINDYGAISLGFVTKPSERRFK
jgi:hypothetical protein